MSQLVSRFERQLCQHLPLFLQRQLADDVRGVVVGELGDQLGDPCRVGQQQVLRAGKLLQLGQRLGGDLVGEHPEHRRALLLLERLDQVSQIAGMEAFQVGAQPFRLALGEQLANPLDVGLVDQLFAHATACRPRHAPRQSRPGVPASPPQRRPRA